MENNPLLYSNSHTRSILSINRSNGGISSPEECQPKQVHPLLISAEPTGGTASKGFFPLVFPFLFITVLNGRFPNSPNFTIKKNCNYLNYGYSASAPKSTSRLLFFTIHDFYMPTWRKSTTWAHRRREDFTGVSILLS